jgi:ATP-dependent Clp protease protease subunit
MGTTSDIELQAEEILELKRICAKILSEATGQSMDKILEDSERDFFMNPEQALKYGLIDKIATQPIKAPASTPALAEIG